MWEEILLGMGNDWDPKKMKEISPSAGRSSGSPRWRP
jgi:hypothetical protein